MVEQILAAHARAVVSVRIVALAEYARVRQVVREKVAQLVDAVPCRPCLFAMSVEAVHSDDAGAGSVA
jgi:hypothetical protein